MSTQILMPALSPTMDVGKLAKWHVREGDEVHAGDVIAEIETDKATMEVEAIDDGTIGKILVAEGAENVPVNQPIAVLLEEGEGTADIAAPPAERPKAPPVPDTAADAVHDTSPEHVMNRIAEQIRANGHGNGHANGHGERHGSRVFASPLARRLAREHGIDLAALTGSGPHGRIVKADVEHAEAEAPAAPSRARVRRDRGRSAAAPRRTHARAREAGKRAYRTGRCSRCTSPAPTSWCPTTPCAGIIAERLTLSKQTIPHFYLAIDCDLEALLAARARLNGMAPHDGPRSFKLSLNDFIVKAMAMALQSVPGANATWTEEGILRHRASDIAVAVALEGGGLHTPVIRSAEVKSLSEISNEMRDLAARARTKRLAPHEYQGGSTTISNLGMYGIDRFDAVINPPQASIMAVGRAEKRPVVKDDALKIATMMSVTLSVDHRVIDGALGAELLAAFKAFIEDPVTMLV